jgi:hypothetical protein
MEERVLVPVAGAAALGTGGISRMASAATVVGLETPAQSKNLELKPYAVAVVDHRPHGASPFDNRGEPTRDSTSSTG